MIKFGRQRVLERAIEPRPRGHQAWARHVGNNAAGRVEPDVARDRDTEWRAHVDPDTPEDRNQRLVRTEAGAAPGQVLGTALEYIDAPADRTQQMRGEHAADRAADDQRVAAG